MIRCSMCRCLKPLQCRGDNSLSPSLGFLRFTVSLCLCNKPLPRADAQTFSFTSITMDFDFPSTQRRIAERDLDDVQEDQANVELGRRLQRFVIGTFAVKLSKMEQHPDNRGLSEENVQRLAHALRESAQTYFNQMSVCIHKDCETDPEAPESSTSISSLPDRFKVFVIEGAHRLKAMTLVAGEQGRLENTTWEAVVYSKGE